MSGRLKQNQITWRLVAAAAALACGVPAQAETPLSLTVSQELRYDSNILRDNSNKYRDAVSSTGVQVGFNKEYGRQTYTASARAVAERYKNTKDYDNEGYDVSLGMSSSLLSNMFLSLDLNAVKQQQSPQDQGIERYKETIDSQSARVFFQYGMYGRFSTNATYNYAKAAYDVITAYDRTSNGLRLGLRYSPTDLLYFDFGVSKTKIESPNYPILSRNDAIVLGDPMSRNDFDLTTRWVVTGFSSLSAKIAYTQERHKRDSLRDYNGLTGRLGWTYTPAGKVTYNLAIDRDTNDSGGSTFKSPVYVDFGGGPTLIGTTAGLRSQTRVSTGMSLLASWQATSKISINGGVSFRRLKEESRDVVPGYTSSNTGKSQNGTLRSMNIGFKYNIARYASVGCGVQYYNRSASLFGREYDGESADCNVIFQID